MPDAVLDFARLKRTGTAEAVLCASKTPAQIDNILALAAAAGKAMLLTRLDAAALRARSRRSIARSSPMIRSRAPRCSARRRPAL